MVRHLVAAEVCPLPAFLTGTSTEYIGNRPLPRVLRERDVIFVLGPKGAGKSTVARTVAGSGAIFLDSRACQAAILTCVRTTSWPADILETPTLVLDGPVWLHNRPGARGLLEELIETRRLHGRRTIVCQADTDASISLLFDAFGPGSSAVVALRFPRSAKARLRVAERICHTQGLPVKRARGTSTLPDWSYAAVATAIRR